MLHDVAAHVHEQIEERVPGMNELLQSRTFQFSTPQVHKEKKTQRTCSQYVLASGIEFNAAHAPNWLDCIMRLIVISNHGAVSSPLSGKFEASQDTQLRVGLRHIRNEAQNEIFAMRCPTSAGL